MKTSDLTALPARIRKKISVHGRVEDGNCWMWQGALTAARHLPAYSPRGRHHRVDQRAASFQQALPQIWVPEDKMMRPAHRVIFCIATGIPYKDMPECRRCDRNPTCVNPDHLTVKGPHRQQLQPDLTKVIKARTAETREAIWARLMEVQPMAGLTATCMADECNLVEIPPDLLKTYEEWYHANPHLIREDDDDDD